MVYFYHFNFSSRENTHLTYENSVDPDNLPRFAATDLGLHSLQCPFHWISGPEVIF